ncbi:lysosomal acid glucosylceramidase-like [Oppia nitens]|uniref:lysosomal acid glucosylceramidase-like n=1 Tax=Oppia nitens TaxID=1686743 RepID=UPI0023DA85BD|nr:lysosomal acid glucosylceramidase-like [Oppia nitens]
MNYLFNTLLSLSLATLVYSRNLCHPQDFGKGSIVCVCNTSYCDDLDPLQKTPSGVITLFETSRNGDRFKQTNLKFGDHHSEHPTKSQTITIDKNKKVQKIVGFGGSFTDATGYMISQLPQSLQEHVIRDYFSANGLEYNLNRLPIGGADFSLRAYSYDDNQNGDFDLKHWTLTDEDKKYKIPYMKLAKQVSPHQQKFFGSPWSAPAWMKTNNQINHGGYLKGNPGEQYYKTFAKYFIKFLDAYKAEGLPMWGITIENEPSAGNQPNYGFNSMGFTKELQRDFLKKDLGPALDAAGYQVGADKLNVLIFDDQRDVIHEWAQTIFPDKDAAKYTTGTAFHWYANRNENLGNLEKAHNVDPSKFILNTEASNGADPNKGVDLGNWNNLENDARDIITDLNHWVAGWVQWNMALNPKGGPNWANLAADAPIIVDPSKQTYYKQPSYYGLGHFTKFILPDSVRIDAQQSLTWDQLHTTVFQRPDGGLVVVVLNTSDELVEFNIRDGSQLLSHVIRPHSIQSYLYY